MRYDQVVLISVDTMRSDLIAANPLKLWPESFPDLQPPATVTLDRLAASGAFFPNTVTAAPYTAAAHGAIFTGRYPLHNGLHEFYNGQLRAPTVFTYARRAGIRTVMKVDFPIIIGHELGFTRDIDNYLVEEDDAFIDAIADGPPSVGFAHFGGVHIPYGFHNVRFGGAAYRDKVDELESLMPVDRPPFTDRLVESYRDRVDTNLLLRYKRAIAYLHAQHAYDKLMQLYADGVGFFVANRLEPFLQRLTGRMAESGKRLLLVLFADHGEHFDDHTNGHFNSMAEHVLRVPLIIMGDGVEAATHFDRVRTVDIAPTVLDLAGIPTGEPFDGTSLAATVLGEDELGGDSPALAEAYTSDLAEFVDYQEKQLSGDRTGPLRHVLVGQTAYLGDRKLVRLPRRYTQGFAGIDDVELTWVERFDEQRVPRRRHGADSADLAALLDEYHVGRMPSHSTAATDEIRTQLRLMGYQI